MKKVFKSSKYSVPPYGLLIIAALAIGYRLLCASVIADSPLFQFPIIDSGYHDGWAKRIVAGDILGHGPDDVFKPPFYAYFLAGIYAVFEQSIVIIQWVQYIIGSLSCVMIAVLSARFLGYHAGMFTGILSAFYAPYFFYESQLLTPALSIALNLLAMLILFRQTLAPSNMRLFFGGMFIGLSAGIRPDVLLPAGFVVAYLILFYKKTELLVIIGRACLIAAGIAVVILPITIRNYHLTNEIIPISSNAGINFYSGNHASADGTSAVPVGLRWERLVSRIPQDILEKPGKASQWWVKQALNDMAQDPVRMLSRMTRKMAAFINRREFRNNICFHFMQGFAWPLRFPFIQFALIFPLSFCGLLAMSRTGQRQEQTVYWLCMSWILGYFLVGVLFFVNSRFRIPVVPFLMIPAGWVLSRAFSDVALKNWRSLGYRASLFLAAGLLSWPMWFGKPQQDWVRDYVNLGNSHHLGKQLVVAEKAFRKAIDIQSDPDAHYLLARSLFARNQIKPALYHLNAALVHMPDSPDLLLMTAQVYLADHNPRKAKVLLEHLIKLSQTSNLWPKRAKWATANIMLANLEPSEAVFRWNQAWQIDPVTAAEASFLARKDMPRVLETFRKQSESKPWDWYAQANFGMVLMENGRFAQSLLPLGRAAKLAPQMVGIRFQLAKAHHIAGNTTEAKKILNELLQVLPMGPLRNQALELKKRLS